MNKEMDGPLTKNTRAPLDLRLAEAAEAICEVRSPAWISLLSKSRKLMQDIGFSDDLKKQLEERIAQTSFKAGHQQAISQADLPVHSIPPCVLSLS